MKIRTRITLQFAAVFSVVLIMFCLVIYYFTSFFRQSDFYNRIINRAFITAQMYLDAQEASAVTRDAYLKKYYQFLPHEAVVIYDARNQAIFRDGSEPLNLTFETLQRIRNHKQVSYTQGDRQVVGIFYPYNNHNYVVVASSIDEYSLQKLKHLRTVLIVGFLGSIVVILIGCWFIAKQALKPISKLVAEVEKITASDLHRRLSQANGKDELSYMAGTFNKMLDRLEKSFEMQNTFVSNASHELRTPLTAMTGELEVALMKNREPEEYRRVLASTLEDARHLTELSNGLLQIASASFDESKIKLHPLRFDELLWEVQEEARKRRPETRFEFRFDNLPEDENRLIVNGNDSLLHIALINVLENAAKFSPEDKQVVSTLSVKDRSLVLQVQDKGLGIKETDLKNVFVPFFRAENVRNITGYGIGLPLAEKIIKLHKGTIILQSKLHVGTDVIITLPTR